MVFSSNIFLFFFLPSVLLLYYIFPAKYRNLLLLIVSLVFYGWGEPVYLFLMIFTILLNYISGRIIGKNEENERRRKKALVITVILNLLLLGFFKYSGFFADIVNSVLPSGIKVRIPEIPLPIGISFYIFQSMSYTIDVYRKEVDVQKDPIVFGAYVTMFPQLIAGPIVRYRDVADQLENRKENLARFSSGVKLFTIGLAKKVIIANKMGALWEMLKSENGMISGWICMFAYTFQIYFDFSGYSDMAIGLGRMLGFEFLRNFNYPYISKSITEFWRRWHISLSTWFKEYVYIPLGGNRRGKGRQLLNIFIVWAMTGLWHGASWNFVLWGLYYGILLTAEKIFFLRKMERLNVFWRRILVIVAVSLGWAIFSFTDLAELFAFLRRLVSLQKGTEHEVNVILAYLPLMIFSAVASTPFFSKLRKKIKRKSVETAVDAATIIILFVVCAAYLASQSYNPFIYFRF